MTTVELSVEVDATPERVWEVVSDPRNLPRWDHHIESVDMLEGPLGPGVRYRVVMRFMALRATVTAEVRAWDPPWHAEVRLSGLLDATVSTSVASLPHGRSVLRHEIWYRFRGPLGGIGASSLQAVGGARIAIRRGVIAQKRDIEDGAS